EYLVGELEPDVVAPPFETLLPDDRVDLVQAEVVDLDVRARWVQLDDGRVIDFDTLVVAPGSVAAFHGVPGVQEHAIPFYTFDDAERLQTTLRVKRWAEGDQPVCVVGGGVVGIELAFALAEFLGRREAGGAHPRIVVLEAMGQILRGFSESMRRMTRRKLDEQGIEVRTSIRVLEVDGEGVVFENGGCQRFAVAEVAWPAGYPHSPLLSTISTRHTLMP